MPFEPDPTYAERAGAELEARMKARESKVKEFEKKHGPIDAYAQSAAIAEWAVPRASSPEECADMSVFIVDQYLDEQPITPEALDSAWNQRH